MDFCKCGSIIINEKCSNEHCPSRSQKHKDWVIDGKNMLFKKQVTYEKAAEHAKRLDMKEKNT